MNPTELMPYIGVALQWARARKRFAEGWYLAIVALASLLFYCLAHPEDAFSYRWDLVLGGWWDQARTVLAMTQLTSSGANIINSARGNAGAPPPALPVTNSR